MRTVPLAAVLAATLTTLFARPAGAQEARIEVAAGEEAVRPLDPPRAVNGAPREQELRERLYAEEALHLDGRRVMKGTVPLHADTFYNLVGRPELATRIRSRRTGKGIAIAAGAT